MPICVPIIGFEQSIGSGIDVKQILPYAAEFWYFKLIGILFDDHTSRRQMWFANQSSQSNKSIT